MNRKLAWATDVHFDHVGDTGLDSFAEAVTARGVDGLVLTGDIAEADSIADRLTRLARRLQRPIWFVLGNHDHYGGSVERVQALIRKLVAEEEHLHWLVAEEVVELAPGVALVGHGGWGDARFGDPLGTPVRIADHWRIEDLQGLEAAALTERLRELGDEAAEYLGRVTRRALASHERVIVATHVPPFVEACDHPGPIVADHWLPFFACQATGQAIREAAREAPPGHEVTVLCGHTHTACEASLAPNLRVRTGGATYGRPAIADILEL